MMRCSFDTEEMFWDTMQCSTSRGSGGWLHARIQVHIHYYTFNMRICTIVFNMAITVNNV